MDNIVAAKNTVIAVFGVVGSAIATAFGGLSVGIQVLLIFITLDYISGLVVAGVFKKSGKTEKGALESRAGWKGLVKKVFTLALVLVAYQMDRLMIGGGTFVSDAVILFFIVNEGLSILENIGIMGVPLPPKLTNALEMLKGKDENKIE